MKKTKKSECFTDKEVGKLMKDFKKKCLIKGYQRSQQSMLCFEDEDLDRCEQDEFIHSDTYVGLYLIACQDALNILLTLAKNL